jgi:uncharacterized protein DUF4019
VVKTIFAATAASALICSAPALALSQNDQAAREAVVQWLQLIDAGRYEEAASQTSQEVHAFEYWLNYFKTHRAPLGRMNKRQLAEVKHATTIPGVPDVRNYEIVRLKTAFERKAAAIEVVALSKMGCCWEIFSYSISAVTSDEL